MKELSSYNRVAGYLNKVFALLNQEFFESTLSRPTITIQSTPIAYGHFSLRDDTWISKKGATHEINIGAGTLARPIEEVCATLLHEMVHYHNYILGIQDCSRGGTYHNRRFRDSAQAHGLIVDHHDKYGWIITSPSDRLLQFCLDNDLGDILTTATNTAATGSQEQAHTLPFRHISEQNQAPPESTFALAAVILSGQPRMSTSAVWTALNRWYWQDKEDAMFFLDKFWKGDVAPGEGRYHPRPEYSKALHIMEQCDDTLKAHLSQEDYHVFREYAEASLAAGCTESCDNFIDGFRLGARMMLDVLTD